jgi:hypothetical protein
MWQIHLSLSLKHWKSNMARAHKAYGKITNLNYLRTAVEVLETGESTEMNTIKILRIMASICMQNVERMQKEFESLVDAKLARNYQDHSNNKLIDILKS